MLLDVSRKESLTYKNQIFKHIFLVFIFLLKTQKKIVQSNRNSKKNKKFQLNDRNLY